MQQAWRNHRHAIGGLVAISCAACLLGYFSFYRQVFQDGRAANPELLFTTVASTDEINLIGWMRTHVSSEDLVLAPTEQAPWFATVPLHSFGSHEHLSISYPDQTALADSFYKGTLSVGEANEMLSKFGVSWVVVPAGSSARAYLIDESPVFTAGDLGVYYKPGNQMRPYPGLAKLRPDLTRKKTLSQIVFSLSR